MHAAIFWGDPLIKGGVCPLKKAHCLNKIEFIFYFFISGGVNELEVLNILVQGAYLASENETIRYIRAVP